MLELVLLRRTYGSWGELHSLCILQRSGYFEGSRGAPAEAQEVLGIEVEEQSHVSYRTVLPVRISSAIVSAGRGSSGID